MAAWKSTLVAIMCLISCSVDGATPQNADAVVPEALVQQSHGAKPIVVPLTDSGNMEVGLYHIVGRQCPAHALIALVLPSITGQ